MITIILALTTAALPPLDDSGRLVRMTALYDEVCLRAFPDDGAVAAMMTAKGATSLTPAQVKVTLRDDPGRGWAIADGERHVFVFVEEPPFHTCSVRWTMAADPIELSGYRAVADRYEAAATDFAPMPTYETDRDGFHIHAVGKQRQKQGGGFESLFLFDQHVTDAKRRAAGETRIDFRFVHQIRSPNAK